jgi:hypothetical protein
MGSAFFLPRRAACVCWQPPLTPDYCINMNSGLNYLLYILSIVLWIVAIVDCVKSNNPNKVVWIIVILLLPFLGSILYFLFGRSR